MSGRDMLKFLRSRPWVTVSAALFAAGVVVLTFALHTGPHAPRPNTTDAHAPLGPVGTTQPRHPTAARTTPGRRTTHTSVPSTAAATTTSPARPTASPGRGDPLLPRATTSLALPASNPTSLTVHAIGISAPIMQLGLEADGTLQVPPLSRNAPAGWYRFSPTPGEHGTAVILGHIDSAAYGPAVFFRLGALRPGDEIDIHRADGITATFRVDRVAQYAKKSFPTRLVYGQTPYASLRLITCGGTFDPTARSYEDNTVVFATLAGKRS